MVDLAAGGYARPEDLVAGGWVDDLPDTAVRLLRSASLRVADACARNPYADAPTGSDVLPLRDAACAQAAVWITSGIDPADVGVAEAAVRRSSLLTGSVEYDTSTQAKAREQAIAGLAPEAVAILTAAGLIYMPVPLGDTTGRLPTFGLAGPQRAWYAGYPAGVEVDAYSWPFQ